jgi:hypothetical protein
MSGGPAIDSEGRVAGVIISSSYPQAKGPRTTSFAKTKNVYKLIEAAIGQLEKSVPLPCYESTRR